MDSDSLKQKQNVSIFVTKKIHDDPSLKFDGSKIPVVDEYKFLGMIFDKKTSIYSPLEISKS